MKITIGERQEGTERVICNRCKKELLIDKKGVLLEDYLHVEKTWGYFSEQDGQRIAFDLCEDCTKWLIRQFEVPVFQEDANELI